jgi:hypothetical protein
LIGAAIACVGLTGSAQAADWQSANIAFRYGTDFREPNNPLDVEKYVVQFMYVNRYSLGSNFLLVDYLKSDKNDPARCAKNADCTGAQELYLVYRHDLSLNKVTGTKNFTIGPFIRDVAIRTGFDVQAKNTAFAPGKRLLVVGPQIQFNVPGFLNVAFNYSKETNNNGITGRDVEFDPAFEMEVNWSIPFQVAALNARFAGFLNFIAPKGKDGFGKETTWEVLSRSGIYFDIGEHMGLKKGTFEIGPGFEFWENKFGNDPDLNTSTRTRAVMFETKLHF